MIEYREIQIGTGGTARCQACARAARSADEAFPLERVAAAVLSVAAAGSGPADGIIYTGFEPFSHPRLPELVQIARESGAPRVCLRTDGGALASGGNAAGALAAGVTHLDVVVFADDEEHDRLTGVRGLAAARRSGVASFVDAAAAARRRVVISCIVPLCRHNAEHAPHAVAAAASFGAVAVCIDARGARPEDRTHVLAALETAAVNGLCGWQVGLSVPTPIPSAVAPWRVAMGGSS